MGNTTFAITRDDGCMGQAHIDFVDDKNEQFASLPHHLVDLYMKWKLKDGSELELIVPNDSDTNEIMIFLAGSDADDFYAKSICISIEKLAEIVRERGELE